MIFVVIAVVVVVVIIMLNKVGKARIESYYKDMGTCYAHMYLAFKDMDVFRESSKEELMFATSLVILRPFVEAGVVDLKTIERQVHMGIIGKTDIAYAFPSQGTSYSMEDIIMQRVGEPEKLACVIKNILLVKMDNESQQELKASDVQMVLMQEKNIAEAVKEVFAMYERGSLTQTNNFREMTADMKYLLDNTDILKWVKQYQ